MKKFALAALVAGFALAGCGGDDGYTKNFVYYEVTGVGASKALITYGSSAEKTVANLPWTSLQTDTKEGSDLYVSAQNQDAAGTVSVKIYIGDRLVKSESTSAPYGIATASARCC